MANPVLKSDCKKISIEEILYRMNGVDALSALNHWSKYHNPTAAGFMNGELYLGEQCVNCPFSDAQKAIRLKENTE